MDQNKHNAQMKFLKTICTTLFYLGMGNCWYESRPQTDFQRLLYKAWMIIANLYNITDNTNILLANLRTDLDQKEQNDLVQFIISHSVLSCKMALLFLKRKHIKEFLCGLFENLQPLADTEDLIKTSVKKSVRISVAISVCAYFALFVATIDGIIMHIKKGVPIRTEVTYYPPVTASGLAINVVRFFIQFHWWFAVTIMVGIDSLCISSLVIVGYKFKTLQVYFKNMRKKVLRNRNKPRHELEEEFKKDFIVGIKMHGDALWCAKNVQRALGNLYSVQIFESVVLIVMCLIKIVSMERNLTFLLANMSYIGCLILLTGAYMLPAGDITHEASMVPTCIFHSGWEQASSRDVRVLVVVALQRSQAPVEMSAFGILTLSYSNFISVIRSSYSFFAVMY